MSVIHEGEQLGAEHLRDGASYHGCTFTGVSAAGLRLSRCLFEDCRFEGGDLSLIRWGDSTLRGVSFRGTRLAGIDWAEAHDLGLELRFEDCVLDLGTFTGLRLAGLEIKDSRGRQLTFVSCDLRGACFDDCELPGARFEGCDLRGAELHTSRGYGISGGRWGETLLGVNEALALLQAQGIRVP